MKASVWLWALACGIVCLACWAAAHLLVQTWYHRFDGVVVPAFTRLVLLPHGWLLFCPFPWLVWAGVLTFRKEVSPCTAVLFSATVFGGCAVIVSSVVLALLLPYVQLSNF